MPAESVISLGDTGTLWEKVMDGEPEVSEDEVITSAMINRQSMARLVGLIHNS